MVLDRQLVRRRLVIAALTISICAFSTQVGAAPNLPRNATTTYNPRIAQTGPLIFSMNLADKPKCT